MDFENLRNVLYLVAAILFIFGIKGLTHPRTAVRGNLLGVAGMSLALVVTLLNRELIPGWYWWVGGIIVGGGIGLVAARLVQMTEMPEMVALFNGFGGIASMLVAGAVLHDYLHRSEVSGLSIHEVVVSDAAMPLQVFIATAISGIIGAVTFSGSILAFVKLREWISGRPQTNPIFKFGNAGCLALAVLFGCILVINPEAWWAYWALAFFSLAAGIFFVMPIGGADMPVVISLLNSYSGLAACATGFVINNTVLIVSGSLVGAAGLILTKIMCVAMNRSLTNVLFGVMVEAGVGPSADEVYAGKVKSASPEEVAMLFDGAQRVCIVPGYGMAVSQAQHAVRDLANLLESRGMEVLFGVHPVAGRMPGHMNVLLAEADVPYEKLMDMDQINGQMSRIDVALIIGANDVVNPDARTNPKSPIAGMPIINVDQAHTVVVVKRSLSPGFAGIPNPLFAADNTLMMFGDGKKAVLDLLQCVKES